MGENSHNGGVWRTVGGVIGDLNKLNRDLAGACDAPVRIRSLAGLAGKPKAAISHIGKNRPLGIGVRIGPGRMFEMNDVDGAPRVLGLIMSGHRVAASTKTCKPYCDGH